jgi:hypothetical protein
MAEKAHSLRVSDDIWDWLKARAATNGSSIAEEVEALCRHVRAEEASSMVQATAGPALRDSVSEALKEPVAQLTQALLPVLESLTLEAMRGRMTGEELLAYLYDGDNLICPYCKKPYQQFQTAASFAYQRSQVILQKARDIFAAGKVPRLRVW